MESLDVLEEHLQLWSVPSDVREAVWRAVTTVDGEGVPLVDDSFGDYVIVAVRGQPAAVYISPSRVSTALAPADAERAQRADSALGLEKLNDTSWIVHCRYGRLDPSRLNSVTALMVRALRRFAPRPDPRQAAKQPRRRTSAREAGGAAAGTAGGTSGGARRSGATTKASPRRTAAAQEERRRVADAAVPRCPVPGCNLPMVGGSCGFHD